MIHVEHLVNKAALIKFYLLNFMELSEYFVASHCVYKIFSINSTYSVSSVEFK